MAQKTKTHKAEKKEIKMMLPVGTRGRIFEGTVIRKFPHRLVIEFERTVYIKKYERFYKKRTRIHARIPEGFVVELGDYIKVRECRPLSKIIHAVVIEKIRSAENGNNKIKEARK